MVGAVTSNASAIAPAGSSRSQIRPKISRRIDEPRAAMTLSKPSIRRGFMPCFIAVPRITSADVRSIVIARISSDIVMTS